MDELPKISMTKLSVDLFTFVGETERSTSRKLFCFRVFTATTMLISLSFIFANFFFIEGAMYVQALQSFLLFAHPLLKYLSFVNYKPNIEALLKDIRNRFWNHRHYNGAIPVRIERICKLIEQIQLIMVMVCLLAMMAYNLKPFFIVNKGLLIESLIPRSDIADAIVVISQFYCIWISFPIVLGYDFIYFALCVHVILQLRLIKYKLQKVLKESIEDTKVAIIKCVQQHQFLFEMFLQLRDIYSLMLLFHYFVTLVTTCSLLLELFLRQSNFMNYFAKMCTVFIFVGQFGLYSFPAEQVASEFADMADAIYTSYWYRNNISNQKMLLYAMMAAQRVHYFSGAGLVNINVDTFESVFRKSFSFCVVFKGLIEK